MTIKTDRERDYIAAIETFYKDHDKIDHPTRTMAYEKAMEQLFARYPDDREAVIFYALSLLGTASSRPVDKTFAKQKRAVEILNPIISKEPNHPGVAHYIIHGYDYPELASLALPAARSYAKIAPSSPHALHMPTHIFTRLGFMAGVDTIEHRFRRCGQTSGSDDPPRERLLRSTPRDGLSGLWILAGGPGSEGKTGPRRVEDDRQARRLCHGRGIFICGRACALRGRARPLVRRRKTRAVPGELSVEPLSPCRSDYLFRPSNWIGAERRSSLGPQRRRAARNASPNVDCLERSLLADPSRDSEDERRGVDRKSGIKK